MLHTPLTKLRKAAPGSLTVRDLARHFARRRFPRTNNAIGAFERGLVKNPPDQFVRLYAEAIGAPIEAVKKAHRSTLREMRRRDPPRAAVA